MEVKLLKKLFIIYITCFRNIIAEPEPYNYEQYGALPAQTDFGAPQYQHQAWNMYPVNSGYTKTGGVKSPTKTASKYVHTDYGNMYGNHYSPPPGHMETVGEGCGKPPIVKNGKSVCSTYLGCRISCFDNYQFPNKNTYMLVKCRDGEWETDSWPTIPDCEPICMPMCQNNGICVAPSQCNCPENFSGPQCQYEKKPCLNNPPLPKNSRRVCSPSSCTITCAQGYKFPDNSSTANLVCKEGNWMPTRTDLVVIPDCQPTCEPGCLNGGMCMSFNYCQCPQKFRGSQCQYSTDACAASKLGFNGGYNCSGNTEGLSCSLSCPPGIKLSSPPLSAYICLYSEGQFGPQPIPQCVYGMNTVVNLGEPMHTKYDSKNSSWSPNDVHGGLVQGRHPSMDSKLIENEIAHGIPNEYMRNRKTFVETVKPKPAICFTWGGVHYKTFDGKVYSYNSGCRHVLVRDGRDNTFSLTVQNIGIGRRVTLFLQDKEYTIEPAKDGGVIFKSTKRFLPIPAQLTGLRVEMAGHMIQMTLETLGVRLKWDKLQFVQVDVAESMWNKTEGLCGRNDGNINNDVMTKDGNVPKTMTTLFDSWQINKIGDDFCENNPREQHACLIQDKNTAKKAEHFCSYLLSKPSFKDCSKIMDISLLYESCRWDYCGCIQKSRETCGCDSLAVYANQCVAQGVASLKNWRDEDTCKMECSGGMMYQWCGPPTQIACGSASAILEDNTLSGKSSCTEGCFCSTGTLYHNGTCVTKDQCPCRLRGKEFPAGSSVPKECNTCTCQNGEWVCTQAACGARCSSIGDPHYQTFDGKRFNFMGKCSYTLVKGPNFSIEAENVACSGSISEAMNLPSSGNTWENPSCTKSLTIKTDSIIVLKQGRVVVADGKEIEKLPVKYYGIKISIVSSLFMKVELPNGIEIWWDGMTRAYIDAPASFQGKTMGLCGTFNSNQKDDFFTPEGDIEQSVIPFANKWKTKERCEDLLDKQTNHPCETNVHNKLTAEKLCQKLKSQLFEECHWHVDVEPFYEDCLYDVCSCEGPIDKCLCPILGAYATECSRSDVQIQWRYNVKECEVHCTGGQIYQVCGDSCARSCYDISGVYEDLAAVQDEAKCRPSCVEGCNCPEGQTLDESGECIPIASCPCKYAGLDFMSQYKEVRPGRKEQELCVCAGARWECKPATKDEIKLYPRATDIKERCNYMYNEVFTTCEPEPITCKNMHEPALKTSPVNCRPGCKCMNGYVLDSITKKCITPKECPCHHGGRSYHDGQKMQEECNTCECKGGTWTCEKRQCAGVCSSWGDSHFRTFDGRRYDFQGVCTYLFAKGCLDSQNDGFSIEIQNEVCGSSGVTCSKSITLKVGAAPSVEVVTFTKNKPLPNGKDLKRIKIRIAGLFVFAEVESLGIVLQWDKGTRVYFKANPSWKGRVKGLCGNYDENESNDFQTPSGGLAEATPQLFGDSWKLESHCPMTREIQDTCHLHPERKIWAALKCGILKQYPFAACHSEIPPDEFVHRCERDTCACNMGGDCECLCTALAAYVHECAARGVAIKWRSQELCPMQCDETCTNYSPCMSTCPVETCENTIKYSQLVSTCSQETCIEGCERKKSCQTGQVYSNDTLEVCVLRKHCLPTCMEMPDGSVIHEGEVIEEDECHSCHCSRGEKICNGQPCSTTQMPTTTKVELMEQKAVCKTGWTEWINNVKPSKKDIQVTKTTKPYSVEIETIPSLFELHKLNGPYCKLEKMVDIECRTTIGHKTAKSTGLEAECSLEKGLFCRQPQSSAPCPDFEIRVKCQCELEIVKPNYDEFVCDEFTSSFPHPTNCSKYFECAPGMGTPEHPDLVEKSCPPLTMFNPHTTECDWARNIIEIKPECMAEKTTTEIYEFVTKIQTEKIKHLESLHVTTKKPEQFDESSEMCTDPTRPFYPHPFNCSLFYHCATGMGPPEHRNMVLKYCDGHQMFNPHIMNCDWPVSVIAIKPECGAAEKLLITTTQSPVTNIVNNLCLQNMRPNYPHEEDCRKFYQCAPGMGPPQYPDVVLKSCNSPELYNPFTMVCDWPSAVYAIRPECDKLKHPTVGSAIKFVGPNVTKHEDCDIGKVWSDCAVDCNKVCLFYDSYLKQNGKCTNGESCIPGCVDEAIYVKKCDKEYFWRDAKTCVQLHDCTCRSHNGKPVKPGEVYRESDCELCQCINNHYVCDKSSCAEETIFQSTTIPSEDDNELIDRGYGSRVPATVSPPPECHPDRYTNVLWDDVPMGDQAFTASSSLSSAYLPHFSKLNGKMSEVSGGSWKPKVTDTKQFIQVKLDRKEPIYGVIMQGNPLFDHFVTSYKVLYSENGHHFGEVTTEEGLPQIFRGPVNNKTPLKQMFDVPIEANYIKIVPLTWHDEIAIRYELIGCSEVETTTVTKPIRKKTTRPKHFKKKLSPAKYEASECMEPIGIDQVEYPLHLVSVSSQKPGYTTKNIKMSAGNAWQPIINSPEQWIMFDLTGPRILTGIVTKGSPLGWVTAYSVQYSKDDIHWSPIMDENMQEIVFPGNYNSNGNITNNFPKPVHGRYIKVKPKMWHNNIQMKIELLGCYEPFDYDVVSTTELDFTAEADGEEFDCNICKGLDKPIHECDCDYPMAYNGFKCVSSAECPCVVGHMSYPVGAIYKKEDCQECICQLGGAPLCNKQKCPPCKSGLVINITSDCTCDCVPCPYKHRICPTTQICIPESAWCDGLEDCPDDEIDCIERETTTALAEVKEKQCPVPSCQIGYKVVPKKSTNKLGSMREDVASDSIFAQPTIMPKKSYMKYYRGGVKGGTKGGTKGGVKSTPSAKMELPRKALGNTPIAAKDAVKECVQWRCVSTRPPPILKPGEKKTSQPPCPAPKCPPEYVMKLDNVELDEYDCPKYACAPPARRDVVCNVTSRTFNTFDGTEYQYDICNHILARDAENNEWDVTVQKNCTKHVCVHELLISQNNDQVRFRPDLTIEYNGYYYTVDQTKKIGFQTNTFAISKLGNTLFFVSTEYGFWVMYDNKGNAKIGVAGKLYGKVDGLCGFYNGKQEDDRRKPDGSQALSTESFGDSWNHKDSTIECEAHTCPIRLQNQAWDICKAISHKIFTPCMSVMDYEKVRARCLEEVCNCLQTESEKTKFDKMTKDEVCLCNSLQTLVTDCLAADKSIDIRGWRAIHSCSADCTAPLVHNDCFRSRCELSCENLKEEDPCPTTPGVCFSGCFCPEGYVRNGDECTPPLYCDDCICEMLGKPQLVTFDKQNFTFDGKCAYALVRDLPVNNKRKFEVYVGYDECLLDSKDVCAKFVHIIHESRTIHIKKTFKEFEVLINGIKVENYPFLNEWILIQKPGGEDLYIVFPFTYLGINIQYRNMVMSVTVPSKLYSGKIEGLCGNCDGKESNDLGPTKDPVDYAKSLRAPAIVMNTLDMDEKTCIEKPKEECWPLPPNQDPCMKIMDENIFGKCHPVVDPEPYLLSCQRGLCSKVKQKEVCLNIEAYTRECRRAGMCLDWRQEDFCPYHCDKNLVYNSCGADCQLTCETYDKMKELCTLNSTEGCFCPGGKILNNGECIDHNKCLPCDSEGHYVGDTWKKDECTKCSCAMKGGVTCVTQACSKGLTCNEGYTSHELTKIDGQCCSEFICVPEALKPPAHCDEPAKINCGYGQTMKLETMANKCSQFICKCIPAEECEPVDPKSEFELLEPGFEKNINKSGCCPLVDYICKPEKCPVKPKCPKFYVPTSTKMPKDCCFKYSCEPPKDKCLHDMEYEGTITGGELKKANVETVLKDIGAIWQDGPCRTCNCKKSGSGNNTKTQATCSVMQCSEITKSKDFEIESIGAPFTCCSQPKYTACKHKGKTYKVGDAWIADDNACESYTCSKKGDGTLEKLKTLKKCTTDCNKGWDYIPSSNAKYTCCGECIPKACVIHDVEYKIDEEWVSDDYCTKYKCVQSNKTVQIQSKEVACTPISKSMKEDYQLEEIIIEGSCCKKISPIACKVNGEIYKEGSTWKSTDGDPCKNVTCMKDDEGKLIKSESVESCNMDCALGWQYVPSSDPHTCCGQCVQTGCVVDNVIYQPNQKWYSADNCTLFNCDKLSDQLLVSGSQESCPDVSGCNPNDIYQKGCCKHCNVTSLSHSVCISEDMPLKDTIGIIQHTRQLPLGLCTNIKPIRGFKRCKGACLSGTSYNKDTLIHDVDCKCCQPIKNDQVIVETVCQNGFIIPKAVGVPLSCSCTACSSQLNVKSQYTKSARKTGIKTSARFGGDTINDDVEVFNLMTPEPLT